MKKLLAILLAMALVLSFAACGGEIERDRDDDDKSKADISSKVDSENSSSDDDTDLEEEGEFFAGAEKAFSFGVTRGNVYESEFIGIGCELPDGWTLFTKDQIYEMNSLETDMPEEDLQETIESATIIYDMYASSAAGSNVNINLENLVVSNATDLTEEEYLEIAKPATETALQQMGFTEVIGEATTVNLGGESHAALELVCTVEGVVLYETLVSVKIGDYIANITFASVDKAEIDSLIDTFYVVN